MHRPHKSEQNKTSDLNLPILAAEQRGITANFLYETAHWTLLA